MIILTTGLFSSVAGIIGSWLLLEKKSLFADTIAHAAFPGITIIFLLTHTKSPALFMVSAIISCLFATYLIKKIEKNSHLKKDTILGIILASSFGIGSMLLSKIQQLNIINSGLITKYFIGNPATIMQQDCIFIIFMSFISFIVYIIYQRKYSALVFDPIFSKTIQSSTQYVEYIMLFIITLIIVAGLQIVGIILMSSLLINPSVAAYQWTKKLKTLICLSAIFGFIQTSLGIYISSQLYHIPPGPIIIIIATMITFISILFSPHGIIISWYKKKTQKSELSTLQLLSRFLLFNEFKTDPFYPHDLISLKEIEKEIPPYKLKNLKEMGYIQSFENNFWALTQKGLDFIKKHKNI